MSVVLCPECGGKVSTTRKTCPHCGFDFSETNNVIKIRCPECEAELELGVAVCPECGFVFDENKVQINSEILYPFDDFESNVISKEQLEFGNYTLIVYEVKSEKTPNHIYVPKFSWQGNKTFYVYLKGPNEINKLTVRGEKGGDFEFYLKNATFKKIMEYGSPDDSECNGYYLYPDRVHIGRMIYFYAEGVTPDYCIIYDHKICSFEIKNK